MRILKLLIVGLILIFVLTWSQNQEFVSADQKNTLQIFITANIYSGLENPTWVVSNKDANSLLLKLNELEELNVENSRDTPFGYSGITIRIFSDNKEDYWDFYSGFAWNGNKLYSDLDREIEKFALKLVHESIDESTIELIGPTLFQP